MAAPPKITEAGEASLSRWGRALGGSGEDQHAALTELAASYWYCIYAWWRRAGLDTERAGTATLASFTRWLGDHHPHIPVLLTSGDATASPRTQIGIPFIPKPYLLAEVDERIKELLARGRARV